MKSKGKLRNNCLIHDSSLVKDTNVILNLILMRKNGIELKWPAGARFSYYISSLSFLDPDSQYPIIKENMVEATHQWSLHCGIKFRHMENFDIIPPSPSDIRPGEVLFIVDYYGGHDGMTYAKYLDSEETDSGNRMIMIYPEYFTCRFNKIGLLIHEIGHLLGFTHECEHPAAPCDNDKDNSLRDLEYDPLSVMNCPSARHNNSLLGLSAKDKEIVSRIYPR